MSAADATASVLARTKLADVPKLLDHNARRLRKLIRANEVDDENLMPDSEEAAEAVDVSEATWEGAARLWGRLTDEQKEAIRAAVEREIGENTAIDLIETIELRVVLPPEPDWYAMTEEELDEFQRKRSVSQANRTADSPELQPTPSDLATSRRAEILAGLKRASEARKSWSLDERIARLEQDDSYEGTVLLMRLKLQRDQLKGE